MVLENKPIGNKRNRNMMVLPSRTPNKYHGAKKSPGNKKLK